MGSDGFDGGFDYLWVAGKSQVIICTKIEQVVLRSGVNYGALGRGNNSLFLVKSGSPDSVQFTLERTLNV